MKAYRQPMGSKYQQSKHHQKIKGYDRMRNTLRELANNYQYKEVRLNCNQSINIVEKPSFTSNCKISKRKQKYIQICSGNGGINILRSCFESYDGEDNQTYVFVSTNTKGNSQCSYELLSNQYAYNSKDSDYRKDKQKRFNQYQQSNRKGFEEDYQQEEVSLKRYGSNCSMSMVEQRQSQYIQSELQQPSSKKEQNAQQVHNNKDVFAIRQCSKIKNDQIGQIPIETKNSIYKMRKEQQNIQITNNNKGQSLEVEQFKEKKDLKQAQSNSHFPQIIKNGYIECESYKQQAKNSFQLASDQQIQNQKQSNNLFHQLQISPILNQTLGINKQQWTQSNNNPQPSQIEINQLNMTEIQNEKQLNQFVQITEKEIEPNRSQFFVRYNFKYIDKKSPSRVVRISPLKFRKKDSISPLAKDPKPPQTKLPLVHTPLTVI